MKRLFSLITGFIMAALALAGCGGATNGEADKQPASPGGKLTVTVLNVGQGDSILVRTPTQTILVDTSDLDEHENLRRELKKHKVTTVDKLITTHPHADHLGGASVVLKECDVKAVYDNGVPSTAKFYLNYLKTVKEKKIAYKNLKAGDTLDFGGGVKFKVLSPTKEMVENPATSAKNGKVDLNATSIVGRLTFGDFAMMLTGDIETEGEKAIVEKNKNIKCQVLKVGHHGSKTSSSNAFLKAVQPEVAIISCGAGNDYGHPHKAPVDRLTAAKAKIYRTDTMGNITVTSDGKTYKVKEEKK